jgi:hypothetical protein
MMTGKATGGLCRKPARVESIDFVKWLKDTTEDADYVVVKMNIEGAEYPLMNELSKNGVIKKVDRFFVNTHEHKFSVADACVFAGMKRRFETKVSKQAVVFREKGEFSYVGL